MPARHSLGSVRVEGLSFKRLSAKYNYNEKSFDPDAAKAMSGRHAQDDWIIKCAFKNVYINRMLSIFNYFWRIIMDSQKNSWASQTGYIWSLIGSAVGFANILSFSAKAYFYGGGAFLVPFISAIIILGIPLLCLEGVIGQYFHLPLVSAYGQVAGRVGKFFGWLAILAVTTIGGYYMLLTGWTVAYVYFTATNSITDDACAFLNSSFLYKSAGISDVGSFALFMFFCTALIGLFAWYVVSRDIRAGIERLCSIFLPMLAIIITLFTIVVMFLPGAWQGFAHYVIPNFAVLRNPRLWLDAFGHIFFSLSLGLGIITGYSRHADASINVARAMLWVTIGDFLVSCIAGFAVFGCIGYMSFMQNVPFESLVTTASPFEIGFVVFPTILKTFGCYLYPVIGTLFFFCIFIAGITGVFSIIESAAGNIEVEFGRTRKAAVTIATTIMMALAAVFCMGNGQYIIGAIDPMVSGFNMLISGIAEIVCFMWLSHTIEKHKVWFTASGKRSLLYYSVRYVAPVLLISVFITAMLHEINGGMDFAKLIRWGWLAIASGIAALLSRSK
jgi:NSS family neurotransmitter:Na+ symporter